MSPGLIFDIRKYSIHDGPGIRTTVFFKGCPLHCLWCHNPEGQSFTPELMVRPGRCLKECLECLPVCEPTALSRVADTPVLDRKKCTACGICADVCPTQAIEIVGRRLGVSEVITELEKDRIFFEESGGGVSFSGGEPLAQPDFLEALLAECRKKEIHTTVDTCGFAPAEALEKIAGKTDLFLYDLKLMDEDKHKEYTGESNRIILENLKRLSHRQKNIVIRLPLLPGINDDETNLSQMAAFLRSLGGISHVSLLPYHRLGKDKYKGLEKKNFSEEISPPSAEKLEKIKTDLTSYGFTVLLGE
jgi:pyruvate formate lyase activating enzyme